MKVVYSEAVVAPELGSSPSAAKPAMVMAAWWRRWPGLEVRPALAAAREDFHRAHSPDYVDAVFDLRLDNGFGTRSDEVNASLPFASGAMLTAARWALAEGGAVVAPVSGFHRAHWQSGGDDCTFNGLMVTALALQAERPGLTVGILDYGFREGSGTADILVLLDTSNIAHISAGARWTRSEQADDFLANISSDLAKLASCDIVLYQAGADQHVDDSLGGFLSTAQLALRDWSVFCGLRERRIPVAWNLAGGDQTPLSKVITIHENSFRACVTAGISPAIGGGASRRPGGNSGIAKS